MKRVLLILSCSFLIVSIDAQTTEKKLPVWNETFDKLTTQDWLVTPVTTKSQVYTTANGKDIILYNGLLKRTFRVAPNVACIDYKNLSNGQQLLRAVKPEAKLTINGKEYNVGGLYGQKENAYLLPEWVDNFTTNKNDFQFQSYTVTDIQLFLKWQQHAWASNAKLPTGKMISFIYQSKPDELKGLIVTVNYELYDGLPLIVKWISIENKSDHVYTINRTINEVLAFVEEESAVVGSPEQMKKQHGIYVETNYAFNNAMRYDISDQTTHWLTDSVYTSQVNYNYQTPCLLEVYPEKVTGVELQPGEVFKSVRTHELLMDSYDRERRGLSNKKNVQQLRPGQQRIPFSCTL